MDIALGAEKNVVPILLEGTEIQHPCLKEKRYVDFREAHNWNKLLSEIPAPKNESSLRLVRGSPWPDRSEKAKPRS
jgi:hypothetical protein